MDCRTENIKELEKIIDLKEKKMEELNKRLTDFTKAKIEYNESYNNNLVVTDFNDVIDGRVTDASKKAYIENSLKEELSKKKLLENDCECLMNIIKVLDDKVKLYSYAIEYLG